MYITHEKTVLADLIVRVHDSVELAAGDMIVVCLPTVQNGADLLADVNLEPSDSGGAVYLTVSHLRDPKSDLIPLGYLTEEGLKHVRKHKHGSCPARFELVEPGYQPSTHWSEH